MIELSQTEINHLVVIDSVAIVRNGLTGDWFIFGNSTKTGKDCTISGTLAEMKKCAKFASKKNAINQNNYGNGSIQNIVNYAKQVKNKLDWSE